MVKVGQEAYVARRKLPLNGKPIGCRIDKGICVSIFTLDGVQYATTKLHQPDANGDVQFFTGPITKFEG